MSLNRRVSEALFETDVQDVSKIYYHGVIIYLPFDGKERGQVFAMFILNLKENVRRFVGGLTCWIHQNRWSLRLRYSRHRGSARSYLDRHFSLDLKQNRFTV